MNTKKDEIAGMLSQAISLKYQVETYISILEGWLESDITPEDWQIAPPTMIQIAME
jgi:hypothetical protein